MTTEPKVLLVDLNNFSRYPTLSVGYLAAVLRRASVTVHVFAPLMVGVRGTVREGRPSRFSLPLARLNHLIATSNLGWLRRLRNRLSNRRLSAVTAQHRAVIDGFAARLAMERPDAVMISTYLMYRDVCADICARCSDAGVPVLVGGPYFVQADVVRDWMRMEGLVGLVSGEVELELPAILKTLLAGDDLTRHRGVLVPRRDGEPEGRTAVPLRELDALPFPDYQDFPWQAYPNQIIPVITGRGCSWGACRFCSDVTSSAGRCFRSRSPTGVLDELVNHRRRYGVRNFVFTDLALNSDVTMWRSIIGGLQDVVPDGQWIGAIYVGDGSDNGLSDKELQQAAQSGCVRLTTGLESGSQRILDRMKKGISLDVLSSYLHGAAAAGISNRCTMIIGYPGETADDVDASADFLSRHSREIERVSLNRFQLVSGTALHRALLRVPQLFEDCRIERQDDGLAQVELRNSTLATVSHRRSVMRLLKVVHSINARELSPRAREFEGVM